MDFNDSNRILTKAYSGANGKKISIEHNGKQYIKGAVFSENLNDDVKYRTLAQQCDFDAS